MCVLGKEPGGFGKRKYTRAQVAPRVRMGGDSVPRGPCRCWAPRSSALSPLCWERRRGCWRSRRARGELAGPAGLKQSRRRPAWPPGRQGKGVSPQGPNPRARRALGQPGLAGRKPRPGEGRGCLGCSAAGSEAGGARRTQLPAVRLCGSLGLWPSLSLLRKGRGLLAPPSCPGVACQKAWWESGAGLRSKGEALLQDPWPRPRTPRRGEPAGPPTGPPPPTPPRQAHMALPSCCALIPSLSQCFKKN